MQGVRAVEATMAELPVASGLGSQTDVPVGADSPIIEIMRTTRAMRHLSPEPVPRELLRAVVEAGTWAPSGGNVQSARYLVVTDPAVMARLAPLWGQVIDEYRLLMTSAGVRADPGPSQDKMAASVAYQREHFAEIPALIVVCEDPEAIGASHGRLGTIWRLARLSGVRMTLRMVRAYGRAQRGEAAFYYPAVENILLAARAYGLAACLTTWHLLEEDAFRRILGIPDGVRTWAIIPVGFPLKRFGPVHRRPVDDVIRWETWRSQAT
jgi:nitroreductase